MERRVEWLIDEVAERDPERPALIYGSRSWTYGRLRAECDRRAGVLIEAGLAMGDLIVTAAPVSDDLVDRFPRLLPGGRRSYHLVAATHRA